MGVYDEYLDLEGLQRVLRRIEELYASKTEVNQKISTVYKPKGNLETEADLDNVINPSIGDVYNINETGDNFVWTENGWDKLGGTVDLSDYLAKDDIRAITNEEIDNLFIEVENKQSTMSFAAALSNGGYIVVEKSFTMDIGLEKADRITISKDTTIALGDSIITTPVEMSNSAGAANWACFYVSNGAKATLTAETGGIIAEGVEPVDHDSAFCGAVMDENSILTVKSGTYFAGNTCFYALKGKIIIEGGTYTSDYYKGKTWILNCQNTNWQNGLASIEVKGGEFRDFDPSHAGTDDAISYVAEGYTVQSETREDGYTWYTVVKAVE